MKIRSTAIANYKRCPMYGTYKYKYGLRPAGGGKRSIHLEFGTLIHDAVSTAINGGDPDELISTANIPPHKYKTRKTAKILVNRLFELTSDYMKLEHSEEPFSFKMGRHEWHGRFDIIGSLDNSKYVVEMKTTSPFYFHAKPSDQAIAYYIAGRMLFGVSGVIFILFDAINLDITLNPVYYEETEIGDWLIANARFLDYIESGMPVTVPQNCLMFGRQCEFMPICVNYNENRHKFEVDKDLIGMKW